MRVVVAAAVLAVFLDLWRRDSGWRLVITPFLFLSYFELVRVLPAFLLAQRLGVTDRVQPVLAASFAYFALLAGFAWACLDASFGGKTVKEILGPPATAARSLRFSRSRGETLSSPLGERAGVAVLALALVVVGLWFFGGLPPVVEAVARMLTGSEGGAQAAHVSQQRFALTKAAYFGGAYRGQGLVRTVQHMGWMMVLAYVVLSWIDRRSFRRTALLAAAILAAWGFVAGDGTRGPFLEVLLVTIAVCSLRTPLSYRAVVALFAAGLLLAVGLSLYSGKMYFTLDKSQGGFLVDAVGRILNRVVIVNGMNDVHLVELVDRGELPLRWGAAHLRAAVNSLPGVHVGVPLSHELFEILYPGSKETTYSSGTYVSTAYVDFGWYGLAPLFGAIGVIVGFAQRWLFSGSPSRWGLVVKAIVAFHAADMLSTGFHGFLAKMVVVAALCGLVTLTKLGMSRWSASRYGAAEGSEA